jgi:methylenetetrahydrofolate dehydrogenase (NADP+)/methenyltetrahydrofolate cyclohydrolase/formyltetrahydrofolate synthetase
MGNKDVVVGAVAGAAAAYALATYLQADKPTAAAAAASPRTAAAASATTTTTDAEVIDGKAISAQIRGEIKASVDAMAAARGGARPGLAVVLVGERKDSATYVRMKKKAAAEVGFHSVDVNLPADASEKDISEAVMRLNADPKIHGILVQLPLPSHVNEAAVLKRISVDKDADGFAALNVGNLCLRGGDDPSAVACTPAGCAELLTRSGVECRGKAAVVVGRSNIVGMPVAALLQKMDATVTVCHSRTRDIAAVVRGADIVVAAIGKPEFIKGAWLKPGCVVIDVGINAVDDATAKRGYRLVGDVDYEAAKKVCSKITPVPGGVGPMTIAMLLQNTLRLAERTLARGPVVEAALERVTSMNDLSRDDAFRASRPSSPPPPFEAGTARLTPVPRDIAISQACTPLPLEYVAAAAGVARDELIPWGRHKAKVDAGRVASRLAGAPDGSLVVVCGINPTPLGEGKSTTTIGLCQALGRNLGKRVVTTIRQPSQGPTFGIKGGAAGGGYSQVIPMEEFNLHMTGDIHAIVAANNLLAAAVDARVFHEATQKDEALFNRLCPLSKKKDAAIKRPLAASQVDRLRRLGVAGRGLVDGEALSPEQRAKFARLDLDPATITWNRVLDTCDRFLRKVEIGKGPNEKGMTREAGFDIAVASEIMAVLALAADAADFRKRLGKMCVGRSRADGLHGGAMVTAEDLGCAGALAVLMKDALDPTLMQTIEGTPVLVHAGPFANIAHGNSSVVADKVGLKLVGKDGFVVTEAGFGADIGGEKCFDIKCRAGDLAPKCAVVVATVRALKLHGGAPPVVAGRPLPAEYAGENLDVLGKGCANLAHHVDCLRRKFGVRVVVACNKFAGDSENELELVRARAMAAGAHAAVVADHWAQGGDGAVDLADAVVAACASAKDEFTYLYDLEDPVKTKVAKICEGIYKAGEVTYSDEAEAQLAAYERQGLGGLPVCIAKTQYSLSTDAKLKGVPEGHTVNVREVRAAAGAGFLYMLCGDIMTVPGLPTRPGFVDIDYDHEKDRVLGLF